MTILLNYVNMLTSDDVVCPQRMRSLAIANERLRLAVIDKELAPSSLISFLDGAFFISDIPLFWFCSGDIIRIVVSR